MTWQPGVAYVPYRIEENLYGRWVIVNARDPELAWSGSHWVEHEGGVGTGRAHVSNFASAEEAQEVAEDIWGV